MKIFLALIVIISVSSCSINFPIEGTFNDTVRVYDTTLISVTDTSFILMFDTIYFKDTAIYNIYDTIQIEVSDDLIAWADSMWNDYAVKKQKLVNYHDSCKNVDIIYWEYQENRYQELFQQLNWRDSIFNDMFQDYPDFVDSLKGNNAWVKDYTIMKTDSGKYVVYKDDSPVIWRKK